MFVYVMAACFVFFLASIANHQLSSTGELRSVTIAAHFYGFVAIAPIVLYGVAAASRLVLWLLGARITFSQARLALFAALLAISPLELLCTAVNSVLAAGWMTTVLSWFELLMFFTFWVFIVSGAVNMDGRPTVSSEPT